jgi:CYTH domain-containing protein
MPEPHKYARIERERRFLLDQFPAGVNVVATRRIHDRYIADTSLRLREQQEGHRASVFKLTQKLAAPASGAQQGLITTIYLSEPEFRLFAQFPANEIRKTRFSVPPFGIDVFHGPLEGLFLAEAEFDSALEADSLPFPSYILKEVSADRRFTGGELVRTSRPDLQTLLLENGIESFSV